MEIIGIIVVFLLFGVAFSLLMKVLGGFGSLLSWSSAKGTLSRLPDFSPAVSELFRKGQGLAIDTARRKLAIIQGGRISGIFDFTDIVAAEVCKNGQTVTQTNRGSQVVGAVVGAVLLGPLGLLVGAVTGSKRTSEKISKLSLKIYTNDLAMPVREIVFYDGAAAEPRTLARQAGKLEQWYGRLRTIVENRIAVGVHPAAPAVIAGPPQGFGRRPART